LYNITRLRSLRVDTDIVHLSPLPSFLPDDSYDFTTNLVLTYFFNSSSDQVFSLFLSECSIKLQISTRTHFSFQSLNSISGTYRMKSYNCPSSGSRTNGGVWSPLNRNKSVRIHEVTSFTYPLVKNQKSD